MAFIELAVVVHRTEIHVTVGHGQDSVDVGQSDGPNEGFLQQAFAVGKTNEGLGHGFAGNRPQSGAGAASDNARDESAHQ